MRNFRKVAIAGGMAAVAFGAIAFSGAAQADPPGGKVPADKHIVGVGAQTDDLLFDSISSTYNATISSTAKHLYSWDAYNPTTGDTDNIQTKQGCTAISRPSGANSGITALEANAHPKGDTSDYCIDYARDSRTRASTDPSSILFLPFAIDAVSWASDRQPGRATNAPSSLSTIDLKAIFSCDASILGAGKTGPVTWDEVGGHGTQAVEPVVPPSSAGTRSFFLSEIGVTTLGSCVQGQDNSVPQNEGTNPIFTGSNSANIVFPYSVAVYLAQTVHNHDSASVGHEFPGLVDGIRSTTGSGSSEKINTKFEYLRDIYNVVRNHGTASKPAVPGYLQGIFGTGKVDSGFICSNASEQSAIASYGFLFDKAECGLIQ